MRALILAAGVGRRLGETHRGPKSLLKFGGRSLMARHLEVLRRLGVGHIAVCVGYEAPMIREEIEATGAGDAVSTVLNPDYRQGSVVSLWTLRHYLGAGGDVLVMDADVLYDPLLLERLVATGSANCFLLDRDFEAGEEPVKLCVHGGRIVEFRKQHAPDLHYDFAGESVGFFRFSEPVARQLAGRTGQYVTDGRREEPYEDAIRDLLLAAPEEFAFEDVTGIPWIEIDFPEDVRRANEEILPLIGGRR